MSDTLLRVQCAIARNLRCSSDDVDPESTLPELGADSIDTITIVMSLEDEFGLEVPDEDFQLEPTVAALAGTIDARLAAKGAAHV